METHLLVVSPSIGMSHSIHSYVTCTCACVCSSTATVTSRAARSAQQQREQEQHRLCTGAQADVITVMSTLRAKLAKWDQGTT